MSEIPGETTPDKTPRGPFATIGAIALAAVAILIVIAMLLPATRSSREAARRNNCHGNLKQIALAISNYEAATGALPPAFTVDADGRRLHSWRTLILPYMEQAKLFESIDLSKPWDDPANAKAREATVEVYACPSLEQEDGFTSYLGVTGPRCVFDGPNSRKLSDVTDEIQTTLLVVDAPADRAVHWMSPHDISDEELIASWPAAKTQHAEVRLAAFLDGHVKALPKEMDAEALRSMTTIEGGETVGE